MTTLTETPPARAEAPEVRRDLSTKTTDDRVSLLGSIAGSLGLTTILYDRLLPLSGLVGFVVVWWLAFLVLYAVVTSLRHGRVEIADRMAGVVLHSIAALVGVALVLVVVLTAWRGRDALTHLNFYVHSMEAVSPEATLDQGGVLHAIVGSLVMMAIVVAITLPLGVATAVYINEVGGRLARVVRTMVESMTALPDVVAGLFIYLVMLIILGFPKSGLAAAIALAITVLPIVARASEVVLRVVANGLREASLALGAPQWRTVWHVVLPTARSGLTTALILGVARGIGETAPVLLTSGVTQVLNLNPLDQPMESLPLFVFLGVREAGDAAVVRGFGAATVLMLLVLVLFTLARIAGRDRGSRR